MTTLVYDDVYSLSNTITEMEDLTIPTGHSAILRLYDLDGNHYGTIEKVDGKTPVLQLHTTSDIQDTP